MTQEFSSGARAALRGLAGALRNGAVRKAYLHMVAVLFAVITALNGGAIVALIAFTPIVDETAWWVAVLYWTLRIVGILIVALVSPIVALTAVNLVFPFLNERLFYASLATINPERAAELSALPGLPLADAMVDAMHRLALFFGTSVLAFLFALVPVVGSIGGPVLQAYLTSRAIGWEMLDPYFDKLGWRFDAQQRFVAERRGALVGFGLPIALMMMIPVVGPLVFGLAQAAAAVLVGEVLERPQAQA